jgi:hypothetical protein
MVPQSFLNNTDQRGVFVPLNMPAGAGEAAAAKVDDYTFNAASWTLIAHEARPGHELQFDSMVEHGVSKARARKNKPAPEGTGDVRSAYPVFDSLRPERTFCRDQFPDNSLLR